MADETLEREVISRFVVRSKRERCVDFVSREHTRPKFILELRNPSIFDPRCVLEVPTQDRSVDGLIRLFRDQGMSGRVYVVSSNPAWDSQKFQMSWFVSQFHAGGFDSLAYCWKSQTGFYEQHHSGFTYFLRTTDFGRDRR